MAVKEQTPGRLKRKRPLKKKMFRFFRDDVERLHFRLRLANFFLFFLPPFCFNRLRAFIYRCCGFQIEPMATIIGRMDMTGGGPIWKKLVIGRRALINHPVFFDLNESITIGNRAAIGHHSVLITTSHDMSAAGKRCGAGVSAPIAIEQGAWVGACVTILPGVTIGAGSVVAAGAVVTKDVPPNTLVGGIPAKFIKTLSDNRQIDDEDDEDDEVSG